jgi:hypothetical protein
LKEGKRKTFELLGREREKEKGERERERTTSEKEQSRAPLFLY